MKEESLITLSELKDAETVSLPRCGHVRKDTFRDMYGSPLTILTVGNGLLKFTAIIERGMDIGEVYLENEKVSWNRDLKYLLHPDNVDLAKNNGTGWLDGFYPSVAAIGPELFGTPGEGFTLHGSGSYSPANPDSVTISAGDDSVFVSAVVLIKDSFKNPIFEKRVKITTYYNSASIIREEITKNISPEERVLDDGLHIQMCGSFLENGGTYVLPVHRWEMLLRDSAPRETDPLYIYPLSEGPVPIRCYQYVPRPVRGFELIPELKRIASNLESLTGITAEMLINSERDTAAYVIRPLDCFPRSLIAKEITENQMFSFEPCRTRPNRMSQKITDGEAFFLKPGGFSKTQCVIGVTKEIYTINTLEKIIRSAV